MINNIIQFFKLFLMFLPFVLFQFLNTRANMKKEVRYKQGTVPIASLVYYVIAFVFINNFYKAIEILGKYINENVSDGGQQTIMSGLLAILAEAAGYVALVTVSITVLTVFIVIKKIVLILSKSDFDKDSIRGAIAGILYEFDENDNCWYLKQSCGQLRTFLKVSYYTVYILSVVSLILSYESFAKGALIVPFCPVLAIIVMGELSFFADGLMKDECKSTLSVNRDNSKHIAMYALLRKPLKKIFGDKLASEGTTINLAGQSGGAAEDILANIESGGDHIGENYAAFMRKKIDGGMAANVDYLRSGYDLATGKSLLFNTPFYYKLVPYAFYAVNQCLLKGKKVLVVMGRHGTENDLIKWCKKGIVSVTNVPDLYEIAVLSGKVRDDSAVDIGIITRSGVHDLNIHKANKEFLSQVGFVIIVEPSRLVTTAQIGLNLLIRCCGESEKITFCSIDRNCDGLVDSLSHILMTNITEVSATEYPHGMSSFMCWKADDEYLQHRMLQGVSRYLGLGTELSFVALKNQVKQTVWYGGDAFPVIDAHWISKQYYYDFLKYANLPATQENFDKCFKASFNMCDERVSDYSYVTVEDDRNNLFEARRNFATIAENQGFVNVISSEYMLREYMADNTEVFTADPKAIPYITADYARTKRNSILSLCLLLCVENVSEEELKHRLSILGIDTDDCDIKLWNEICAIFSGSGEKETDKEGNQIIVIDYIDRENTLRFDKASTIIFKREYSVELGKFENVYTIENKEFADVLLDDLQSVAYIAEYDEKDCFIGTELKGHVYQKYLPGQLFTMNGKYYEMLSATSDNKIMLRRASEHINGRMSYRQIRKYTLEKIRESEEMWALKTVNNIGIHYLHADFEVEIGGYWKMKSYNDFENGTLVELETVPVRKYFNKQILKLDFSRFGERFTPSVRKTLTVLLNEVFVTIFAENQPFISAVAFGEGELPSTYSLYAKENREEIENSIFIIEDSQLDIGLLVAVERNLDRILHIISDYLMWNQEKVTDFLQKKVLEESFEAPIPETENTEEQNSDEKESLPEKEEQEKVSEKADNTETDVPMVAEDDVNSAEETSSKESFFVKIGNIFKALFRKKKKQKEESESEQEADDIPQTEENETEDSDTNEEEKKDVSGTETEERESEVVYSE